MDILLNLFYKIPCLSNKDLYQIVPINSIIINFY